jgi:hypothetical protein
VFLATATHVRKSIRREPHGSKDSRVSAERPYAAAWIDEPRHDGVWRTPPSPPSLHCLGLRPPTCSWCIRPTLLGIRRQIFWSQRVKGRGSPGRLGSYNCSLTEPSSLSRNGPENCQYGLHGRFLRDSVPAEQDHQRQVLVFGELGNIGSQPPPSALKSCTKSSDTLVVLVTYCCSACKRVRSASSTVRKSPIPSL